MDTEVLQYLAVAGGAFVGMLWPFLVALLKHLSPNGPDLNAALAEVPSALPTLDATLRFFGWLLLCGIVAGVVALLNIVPLVAGDAADKLKALGDWQYAFLVAEGFGLASFFEEGLRPRK